jgi:hypothetical protein
LPGTNVTLVSQAFGAGTVRYQWRFEGTNIPNATNATYSFTNANLAQHHGTYSVEIVDDISTAVSSNAFIYVLVQPFVVQHIVPQSILQGRTLISTLVATGAPPMFYRWITNGAAYTTTSVPVLVFSNVQRSFLLRASVTNAARPSGIGSPNAGSVQITMLPDFDGDGISDWWETNYFGNVGTTNTAANALVDADGDGRSNLEEYLSGTNPTDPASVLKILLDATNGTPFQFIAQSNISYTVQWRSNLITSVWSNLTSISAQPLVRTVEVNAASAPLPPERYIRVVTPLVP